jgi:virginiamycin A acetyltransferase
MEIGDFSYFGHLEELDDYAGFLAPYLFPLSPEKLVIGKFCQIAHGARFVTSSANHNMNGFSTFPFNNFTMHERTTSEEIRAMFDIPGRKGDTVVGNDVWIGTEAMIMPGITIGDGAIIGARAVVVKDVPPYTIVGGNPAKKMKQRFANDIIKTLLEISWWDWPVHQIERHINAITGGDIEKLRKIHADQSRRQIKNDV